MKIDYSSVQDIKKILNDEDFHIKQKFGQNFLINRGAREQLVRLLDPRGTDHLWEIGPGLGAMTSLLVGKGRSLTLFEIDRGYADFLVRTYPEGSFTMITGDCLKTMPAEADSSPPDGILGNLPYYSASSIISKCIERKIFPERMIFTVQEELADRMTARPGGKNYSSFSIFCQAYFKVKRHLRLQPGSFYPRPKVTSAVIELTESPYRGSIADPEIFSGLCRALFSSRRKTIKNNLAALKGRLSGKSVSAESLHSAFAGEGIELSRRPETITVENMIRISGRLAGLTGGLHG
jgi:16S rRNA (adenine1518-N6/adenine1519-N6)-dimethyltransferase